MKEDGSAYDGDYWHYVNGEITKWNNRTIAYKAVINGKVTDIPAKMFMEGGNYPTECKQGASGMISSLIKGEFFEDNGAGEECTFKGWFLDEACTQAFTGDISALTGDSIILYAKISYAYWSPVV